MKSSIIQSNLGYRAILFSAKSVFDQKIRDFYVSDFEHKFGSRPNQEKQSKHKHVMMLHPLFYFFLAQHKTTKSAKIVKNHQQSLNQRQSLKQLYFCAVF